VAVSEQLDWPDEFSEPVVQRTVEPFFTCTVPVGLVGLPGVTITLNVVDCSDP
jgi:hypothetical protein